MSHFGFTERNIPMSKIQMRKVKQPLSDSNDTYRLEIARRTVHPSLALSKPKIKMKWMPSHKANLYL